MTLFGAGEERIGGSTVDGAAQRRRGFTQAQIDRVIEEGGSLPLAVLLRCRMRYFTEGSALGSRRFLQDFLTGGGAEGCAAKRLPVPGAGALGLVSADRRRRGAISSSG